MIWIVLGMLILFGLFAGIFAAMATVSGWRVAAAVWALAIATTGAFALALWLISLGTS